MDQYVCNHFVIELLCCRTDNLSNTSSSNKVDLTNSSILAVMIFSVMNPSLDYGKMFAKRVGEWVRANFFTCTINAHIRIYYVS